MSILSEKAALAARQELTRAIEQWNKAITLDATHEDSLYNLAVALMMQEDYDGAWEAVRTLQRLGKTVDKDLLSALNTGANTVN